MRVKAKNHTRKKKKKKRETDDQENHEPRKLSYESQTRVENR